MSVSNFPFLILEYGFLFFSFFTFFIGLLFSPVSNSSRFAWFLTLIISLFFSFNYIVIILADQDLNFLSYYDSGLLTVNYIQLLKLASLLCLSLISFIGIFVTLNTFTLEFVSLITFSQCATLFLLSTDHILIILLFLETQALIGYILTVYKRSSIFATEAGIKYFLLGGVSSSLLVLGLTLLYSVAGSFYLTDVSDYFLLSKDIHFFIGSLILFAFFFKLSAAPFHFWTPDVYEDVEYLTIGYFSTIPKISVLGLLSGVFLFLVTSFSYLFLVIGFFSLLIGTINGVYQNSLKRLLAYSTITNTSYVTLVFAVVNFKELAIFSVYFQFLFYSFSVLLFIAAIQILPNNKIESLSFFYYSPTFLKVLIIILIFSLAGVPPLLGFFSKVVILYNITDIFLFLVILLPLFSLFSQFYYTRVVVNSVFFKSKVLTNYKHSFQFLLILLVFAIIVNVFFSLFIYLL